MAGNVKQRILFVATVVLLVIVCGRVFWLFDTGKVKFESDLASLLPVFDEQIIEQEIDQRVSTEWEDRIIILVMGRDHQHSMDVTDLFTEVLEEKIEIGEIKAEVFYGPDPQGMASRINAMSQYLDRLVADRSVARIDDSPLSQLRWRREQIQQFPPANLTGVKLDPFGTLDNFLSERMPDFPGVIYDGLYFRLKNHEPGVLLIVDLAAGSLGGASANQSTTQILQAARSLEKSENTEILVSGFPVYASEIRDKTVTEITWMSILAAAFTLFYFLVVTRSILALAASITMIVVATAGAIAFSQATIGFPHLIGLTMATAAIGICIDFSFHFWVHVRSGKSGTETIESIRGGLNMSFLTTAAGVAAITFVSIPVLEQSAMFILGALLVSWLFVSVVFPELVAQGSSNSLRSSSRASSQVFAKNLKLVVILIIVVSVLILAKNYQTDDSPKRLGQRIETLENQEHRVKMLLGADEQSAIYLVSAENSDKLLLLESRLMSGLNRNELLNVRAVSRLVPDRMQQLQNQEIFRDLLNTNESSELTAYLEFLNMEVSELKKPRSALYSLDWVLNQEWSELERGLVLDCKPPQCASMVRAKGPVINKLDMACNELPACKSISLSGLKKSAFASLRHSLGSVLVGVGLVMFIVLFLRYRVSALKMILVPVLACVSGLAAVSALGLPITTFSLAALFPLIGLSIDYVVFIRESSGHLPLTLKAVSASAITTTISFSILTFSSTPAIQFFALPVAVGIPVAWIFVRTSWFKSGS